MDSNPKTTALRIIESMSDDASLEDINLRAVLLPAD